MYYPCSEKTKALINLAVTAKLICTLVSAYANCLFSHVVAHLISQINDKWTSFELCH